jgi:hypothetical protein
MEVCIHHTVAVIRWVTLRMVTQDIKVRLADLPITIHLILK